MGCVGSAKAARGQIASFAPCMRSVRAPWKRFPPRSQHRGSTEHAGRMFRRGRDARAVGAGSTHFGPLRSTGRKACFSCRALHHVIAYPLVTLNVSGGQKADAELR